VTAERSTISGNRASAAAGIYSRGDVSLRNVTVTRNSAVQRSGGLEVTFLAGEPAAITRVANTIIAGNIAPLGAAPDCLDFALTGSSLGYNLTTTGGGCPFAAAGDRLVSSAKLFTEVLEADLKDNGGPTKTHALIARGRAVDAGYCPGQTADQRGFKRPVDDPLVANARDACDIGASDLQGPVVATADVMVSQTVDKTSVKQGELLTYFVRVQNLGPQTAPNVVVNDVLPSGVTFVEARNNKGSITAPPKGETSTVTWRLGDILSQANEVAEIRSRCW